MDTNAASSAARPNGARGSGLPAVRVRVPDEDYWLSQINCQSACPVRTDARGYVRAIAAGEFEAAYLTARGPNPLAAICGRVCAAPCEAACRRGAVDQPVAIRALKRFVTERYGPESVPPEALAPMRILERARALGEERDCAGPEELRALPTGAARAPAARRVAIVGSGPAGLAAAHDLALLGIAVTVFEMHPVPAGMLAVGIPEYRLPRNVVRGEVDLIRSLGVEFVCDTKVGEDVMLGEIRARFDATIIAVGAPRSRVVPLPGADGPGVVGGVEFLRDLSLDRHGPGSTLAELGRRVVVIGGGNVAYDVSRSVIRQVGYDVSRSALRQMTAAGTVQEVHLCCLESVEDMPADDVEILEGHEEGVTLHPSLGPVEIHREGDGRVRGVTFQRCLRVLDEAGRFAPLFDGNDLTTIGADTVIWAIGQAPDLSFIDPRGDIDLDERGHLRCDPLTLRSSAPDVFLAGDIAYGTRLLIDAVASGKKCARAVYTHLTGSSLALGRAAGHRAVAGFGREYDYEKLDRTRVPVTDVAERKASQAVPVERGYDAQSAMREASRCLDCGVNTIFDSELCILCGGCADVCPELCLELVSCDRLTGADGLGDVLRERYADADLAEMSAIVKDEERCIRCGLCAERCPTGAITMERLAFAERWSSAGARAGEER